MTTTVLKTTHGANASPLEAQAAPRPPLKCRVCGCRLNLGEGDDPTLEVCASCKVRPEARRLGLRVLPKDANSTAVARYQPSAREFTDAEKALIKKVHGYVPAQQLLVILNERLTCDLGPDAVPYSMEQLHAQIVALSGAAPPGGHGWASLRKLLAQARRNGVLAAIDEQVINDFAVVFSLNPKQVLQLRDIVLQASEGRP